MDQASEFVFDIPVRPREPRQPRAAGPACAVAGCAAAGSHRAPVSPDRLGDYMWLCLDHVRDYNRSWDFFRGKSDKEIERFIRESVTGHRPTWAVGLKNGTAHVRLMQGFADPYRIVDDGPRGLGRETHAAPCRPMNRLQSEALSTLHLDDSASLNEVKARYKELVKRYHPDANGGDRSSEEHLKRVIRAYRTLRASNFS